MGAISVNAREKAALQDLPNHTISVLEAIYAGTNLIYLAGDIAANDGGKLLDKDADVLHVTVEWIDGDGGIPHHDFPGAGRR
jgi:hypothetical protein